MRERTDLRQIMADAGFRLLREKNHLVWACSCGKHLVTTPNTPSDTRSFKNAKADVRRTLRLCG